MNLIRIKFTIITLLILLTTATWATNEDIIVGEGNIQKLTRESATGRPLGTGHVVGYLLSCM